MKRMVGIIGIATALLLTGCTAQSVTPASINDVSTDIPTASCSSAMLAAAEVDLSQVNDAEFIIATQRCSSVEDWTAALEANPDAIGSYEVTTAEAIGALELTCSNADRVGVESTLCDDARSAGAISSI